MTNHPNPEIDRQASEPRTTLDGSRQPAAGRWRSIEAHAWIIVRSGHGLASEVTTLGPTQSGTVDLRSGVARSVVRLELDLHKLVADCESCRTARPDVPTTMTLESTDIGQVADNRWALVGRLSGNTGTTLVDSELELRHHHEPTGQGAEARFIVRTHVPVAALGLCDTHVLGHVGVDQAELVTHLLATRDTTA